MINSRIPSSQADPKRLFFGTVKKPRKKHLLLIRPTIGLEVEVGTQLFLERQDMISLGSGQDHGDPGSGRKIFGAKTVRDHHREGKPAPMLWVAGWTRNPKICWLFCRCTCAMQRCRPVLHQRSAGFLEVCY